ncbi:DUF1249 domain-containing protein [Edwardsiella ictaluri]|uniref:Uncharacterized protein n=1 Tax=Edwardsiella ictaluri (strain 93-146) TaxID=634503 RepID=C5B6Y0_EDWI9|nr:hypothetical protein NT01EI_0199 [Edwardsiella ictaluri 93-146]ARD40020.1 hypothetical protein B6E78_12140 [Edwardsiella ictaluri]AVZ82056.1 DUF1249 domain-containing protein [Edwardsiella ictaluri]EKS7763429.1 DUF1249 domain-containing protein [Edwardsiella ictaluri]EKS7770249.1 DUF1249 domain-containing protein [Edwardsiella ictaluri]
MELCAIQQISQFKARYDNPNKKLHQCDEKHQINWISANGCSAGLAQMQGVFLTVHFDLSV